MNQFVSNLLRTALEATVESSVELGVRAVFDRSSRKQPANSVQDGVDVMHAFLLAIAQRDSRSLHGLAASRWTVLPETADLLAHTWEAAPPVDWNFDEVYVPTDWAGGTPDWIYAELTVTFAVGEVYETIPAVMRTCPSANGWQVDYLAWGTTPEPDPEPITLVDEGLFDELIAQFEPFATEPTETVECAGCGQLLLVPTDQGQLHITCPSCNNAQWYTP